jgi:hypothetical protein
MASFLHRNNQPSDQPPFDGNNGNNNDTLDTSDEFDDAASLVRARKDAEKDRIQMVSDTHFGFSTKKSTLILSLD